MATYHVDKGFRFDDSCETRRKGEILELSGEELIFALENKCLTKVKGAEPEEKPKRKRRTKAEMQAADNG